MKWFLAFIGGRQRAVFVVQLLVALLVTVVATIVVTRPTVAAFGRDTPIAIAEDMQRSGRPGPAERVFWDALTLGPVSVPLLIAFLDNHHGQRMLAKGGIVTKGEQFIVPEEQVDALLAREDVPEETRLLGKFWQSALTRTVPKEVRDQVVALANREPPAPYTNRLLGLEARRDGQLEEAAARLEREALRFPERREDLLLALRLLEMAEAWEEIGARVKNPALADRIPPRIRYAYAVRTKDFKLALSAIVATAMEPRPKAPLLLAGISGFMWMLFAVRLGRVRERLAFRLPIFLLAFVLGVFSIVPTLIVIGLEETLLNFRERGELLSDLIFFTIGVGLREEVCKLLLFLPLLPILRKWGTRLDVLACGTLVGLGFATEENINYLQNGLSTALSRFLTANFLHMALTAMLSLAAFDLSRDVEKGAAAFSRTLLTVVAMHGAYDFFLSNQQVDGLSFLSMTIFVILTRMYMNEVTSAAKGAGRASKPLLPRFAQAVIVVTCASFVYASTLVGPASAALALTQGMLGMILIVIMFVQEMRRA